MGDVVSSGTSTETDAVPPEREPRHAAAAGAPAHAASGDAIETGKHTAASVATAEPASVAAPPVDAVLTHRQGLMIPAGLMCAMFLAALDQTIVATAMRTIADDLSGFSIQAWATTAFLITSTIATPLYGKLSDMYGRKPFILFAVGIFIAGSALCGLAQNMYELAAFRAVQGIGAGGLFSLALAIIGDIVPPRDRA